MRLSKVAKPYWPRPLAFISRSIRSSTVSKFLSVSIWSNKCGYVFETNAYGRWFSRRMEVERLALKLPKVCQPPLICSVKSNLEPRLSVALCNYIIKPPSLFNRCARAKQACIWFDARSEIRRPMKYSLLTGTIMMADGSARRIDGIETTGFACGTFCPIRFPKSDLTGGLAFITMHFDAGPLAGMITATLDGKP